MNTYLSTTLLFVGAITCLPGMAQQGNQLQQQYNQAPPNGNNIVVVNNTSSGNYWSNSNNLINDVSNVAPTNKQNTVRNADVQQQAIVSPVSMMNAMRERSRTTTNSSASSSSSRSNTRQQTAQRNNNPVVQQVVNDDQNDNANEEQSQVNVVVPQNVVETTPAQRRRDRTRTTETTQEETTRSARTPRTRAEAPAAEPVATPEPNAWANRMAARGSSASGGSSNVKRRNSHYSQQGRTRKGKRLFHVQSKTKKVKSNRDCFTWNS